MNQLLLEIYSWLDWLLGLEHYAVSIPRMMVRAVVVYGCLVLIIRLGERRFMGKNTVFDFILGIVLGSVSSRAITDSAPFFATLGASMILVLVHWLFSVLAFHTERFGPFIKGMPQQLIKEGKIQHATMQRYHITERDLNEYLRQSGSSTLDQVAEAWLERNGQVSILEHNKDLEPHIIDIQVADGVQTVRVILK